MTDTILQSADYFLPVSQTAGASAPALYSNRVRLTSDAVATGRGVPNPSTSAGTPSDRARHLRLYGGPSLETLRDDLDTSVKLFSAIVIISSGFGMYFAGEGYVLGIPLTCAVLSIVSVGGLFLAASRRNRHAARIEFIEEIATAAVAASILPQMGEAKAA